MSWLLWMLAGACLVELVRWAVRSHRSRKQRALAQEFLDGIVRSNQERHNAWLARKPRR